MDKNISLIVTLQSQIQELEEKVAALRVSRRILMNLLDCLEKEKCEQFSILENQNNKLKKSNWQYAQTIMSQNLRIAKLEEKFNIFSDLT